MTRASLRAARVLLLAPALLLLASPPARAADEGFLKRPRTVQNRRFQTAGASEFAGFFNLSMKNKLTEHYGGAFMYSYHFGEQFALDVMLEGGLGRLTGLVDSIRSQARLNSATATTDLADAGSLLATGQLGVRWTPFYGKVNLSAELPVHFNFSLAAGAGAALVRYDSILQCAVDLPPNKSTCPDDNFLTRTAPTFAFNVGGGFRFFLTEDVSARFELRNVIYPDSYRQGFVPKTPHSNPGSEASNPGITFNPLLFFGVAWLLH